MTQLNSAAPRIFIDTWEGNGTWERHGGRSAAARRAASRHTPTHTLHKWSHLPHLKRRHSYSCLCYTKAKCSVPRQAGADPPAPPVPRSR